MGRRGPNRQDFAVVKGTSKRRKDEPAPAAVTAEDAAPPVSLLAAERKIFDEVCRVQAGMRTLTDADLRAICTFAQLAAERDKLIRALRRYARDGKSKGQGDGFGCWRDSSTGGKYWVKHPELGRLEKVERLLLQYKKELYMTPAARSGGRVGSGGAAGARDPDREKLYGG